MRVVQGQLRDDRSSRIALACLLGLLGVAGLLVALDATIGWLREPGWQLLSPRLALAPVVLAIVLLPLATAVGVWRNRRWGWILARLLAAAALALALLNRPGSFEAELNEWLPALLNGALGLAVAGLLVRHWAAGVHR